MIKTINASLIVVGTSVGAGILALPVETSRGGALLSFVLLFLVWVIMTTTALMLIEVLSEFETPVNFFTLTGKKLGSFFKILTFLVYIFLYFSLILAYVKGGGIFFSNLFDHISPLLGCSIFLLLFAPLIICGARVLSFGNNILVFSMFASFFVVVMLGISEIKPSLLLHFNWKFVFSTFPIFVTSFGFHNVIPSLFSYVGNKKDLQVAVCIGTTTTFCIYLIWQIVVLGIVPFEGENSLKQALAQDQTAVPFLQFYLKSSIFSLCAQVFYFAALTTSFLGVGWAVIDFFLDAFAIKYPFTGRIFVTTCLCGLALWIAQTRIRVFYISLTYGAGSACFYLLIFLPTLLFFICKWEKRKKRGLEAVKKETSEKDGQSQI